MAHQTLKCVNLLIALLLVCGVLNHAYAAFPGAKIAYKNIDGKPVGICDPQANVLLDGERSSGAQSQSKTNVAQSCVGQGIAFSSPCDPNITKEKDDPFVRHTRDEQGYNKNSDLGPQRGPDHTVTILAPLADKSKLPSAGNRSITLAKIGTTYWVRIFDVTSTKVVDQSLDEYVAQIPASTAKVGDKEVEVLSLEPKATEATDSSEENSVNTAKRSALATIKQIIDDWGTQVHNEKTVTTDQTVISAALSNTLLVTDYVQKGDIVYLPNSEGIARPQMKLNSQRSCAALERLPKKPFAVGVTFSPEEPPVQDDQTSWPPISREIDGPAVMPEKYLPTDLTKPERKNIPIYDNTGKQINPLDPKVTFNYGKAGDAIAASYAAADGTTVTSPLYETFTPLYYTGKRDTYYLEARDGITSSGLYPDPEPDANGVYNGLNKPCLQGAVFEHAIIYRTNQGKCEKVQEDYPASDPLRDPCTNIPYNIGDKIRSKDSTTGTCRDYIITSDPIESVSSRVVTTVPGGLYNQIFTNEAPEKMAAIQKLKSKTVDIEIGKNAVIHEAPGIVFEVRLENSKACVYAHEALNPAKEWRVDSEFPTSQSQIEDKTEIKGIPCKSSNNVCLKGVCVAPSIGEPGPGLGEHCLLPKQSPIDKSQNRNHCVDAPAPVFELHTLVFSSLISKVCTNYDLSHAHASVHFTSAVVECIEQSVQQIFYPPPGATESFFDTTRNLLKGLVRVVLTLYVIIFAYSFMIGKQPIPGRAKSTWFVLQFSMVVYFAMGSGMTYLFPKFVTVSKSLSIMMMEAGMGMTNHRFDDLQSQASGALYEYTTKKKSYEDTVVQSNQLGQDITNNQNDKALIDQKITGVDKELNDIISKRDTLQAELDGMNTNPGYQTALNDFNAKRSAYNTALATYNSLLQASITKAETPNIGKVPGDTDSDHGPNAPQIPMTYTVPLLCKNIEIDIWGGGASGQWDRNASALDYSGGAGGYVHASLAVTPGVQFTGNIGRGGGGYTNGFNNYAMADVTSGGNTKNILDGLAGNGAKTQFFDATGKEILYANGATGITGGTAGGSIAGVVVKKGNNGSSTNTTKLAAGASAFTSTTKGSESSSGQLQTACSTGKSGTYAGRAAGPGAGGCATDDGQKIERWGGGGNGRIQVNCTDIITTPTYNDLIASANRNDQQAIDLLNARNAVHDTQTQLWMAGDNIEVPVFQYYCAPGVTSCQSSFSELKAGGNPASEFGKWNAKREALIDQIANLNDVEYANKLKQKTDLLNESSKKAELIADQQTQKEKLNQSITLLETQYQEALKLADSAHTALINSQMEQPQSSMSISNTGYSYCDFRSYSYTEGYESMKLWDMVDCKLAKYLGIGDNPDNASVPQVLWLGMLSVISSGYGIPIFIFTLLVLIFIIMVSYRVVHIYIMAFIALALLVYISPLFIPAVLFEQTKKYFKKWMAHIISYILQPVILFAFLSFMFAVTDEAFFGKNHVFDAKNQIVSTRSADGTGANQVASKALKATDCDDPNALACIYQVAKTYYDTVPVLKMRIYRVDFDNDQDKYMFIGLLKLLVVVFIAFYVLQLSEELSSKLTGGLGTAASASAMPVLNMTQSVNILGGAMKATQELAIGAVEQGGIRGVPWLTRKVWGAPAKVSRAGGSAKRAIQGGARSLGLFDASKPPSGGSGMSPVPGENPKSPIFQQSLASPTPPTPANPLPNNVPDSNIKPIVSPATGSAATASAAGSTGNTQKSAPTRASITKDLKKLRTDYDQFLDHMKDHRDKAREERGDLVYMRNNDPSGMNRREWVDAADKYIVEHDQKEAREYQQLRQEAAALLQKYDAKNQELKDFLDGRSSSTPVQNNNADPFVGRRPVRPAPPPPRPKE